MTRALQPLLSLLLVGAMAAVAAGAAPATRAASRPVPAKTHSGEGWAMVAPAEWRSLQEVVRPPMVLYLSGDGKGGMPQLDGTLSPLQIGLTVEVFAAAGDAAEDALQQRIDRDIAQLKREKRFKPRGEPTTTTITLADGMPAILFEAEFDRLDRGRLSLHQRVYAADKKGRHLMATGFIACGIGGGGFIRGTGIYDFVQAHLRTLVLDPAKVDITSLQAAYEALDAGAAEAIAKSSTGNDLIAQERFADAIRLFRGAIDACDSVSAAHNGLSWSILQLKDPLDQLADAEAHAEKAVELTTRRDFAALDTLAVAYHRRGKREQAMQIIKEALRLAPSHPELQARLKEFEGSGN